MSKLVRPRKKITLNPITGQMELVSDNNFSYESVPQNKKMTIPENHQMLLHDGFELEGDLDLHGSLILEE